MALIEFNDRDKSEKLHSTCLLPTQESILVLRIRHHGNATSVQDTDQTLNRVGTTFKSSAMGDIAFQGRLWSSVQSSRCLCSSQETDQDNLRSTIRTTG